MILSIVIITMIVITGVFLTNPLVSFVTAIQSSNMAATENGILVERHQGLMVR